MCCPKCSSTSLDVPGPPSESATAAARLESEMSLVELMMEQLTARRAVLQRKINALSPISRLPPEILTEIFRTACIIVSNPSQRPVTPLFFGGICKEWREIAWSTPLLWNSICLTVSKKAHGAHQTSRLLTEWLSRAKASPLFIKLTSEDEHEAIFCSVQAILDVLVTRAEHWYSLDCLLPPQCHDALKNHEFPILASVSLRPPKGTISTFSEPPCMFLAAPKLVDVDLSGYNFPAMVLPWSQLRRFKTQFLTVSECLKVLRRSPELVECYFESVYSPEILLVGDPPVTSETLPSENLQVLKVFLIKSAAISLLDNLTLPKLRVLDVTTTGTSSTLLGSIRSLVLRSPSCQLRRLSIEKHMESGLRDDELIACLTAMPSLTHLRLSFYGALLSDPSVALSETLVSELRPSTHRGGEGRLLVPNLTCFEYRGAVTCDSRSLVDMLHERWHLSTSRGGGNGDMKLSRLTRAEIIRTTAGAVTPFGLDTDLAELERAGMDVGIYS